MIYIAIFIIINGYNENGKILVGQILHCVIEKLVRMYAYRRMYFSHWVHIAFFFQCHDYVLPVLQLKKQSNINMQIGESKYSISSRENS